MKRKDSGGNKYRVGDKVNHVKFVEEFGIGTIVAIKGAQMYEVEWETYEGEKFSGIYKERDLE